jgi:Ser/Thr protein kinase RdoA (MazF antagonist)
MEPYASLSLRGQVARLRRLGHTALAGYGLEAKSLTLLRHEQNTTFRVEAAGGPYVLRINRTGVHTPVTIGAEMAWLRALRRDTDLEVPDPVAARDGALVISVQDEGVPGSPACVLLRWLDGRFLDARLTPAHLREVGRLQAGLHQHAARWTPPDDFARPRVDTLTETAKRGGVAGSAASAQVGEHPSAEDADRGRRLVAELLSDGDATVFGRALDVVWTAMHELAAQPGSLGVVHGDLHQENYLFHAGAARAIDFDDCGWGFFLYDLAVTLSELERHARYRELRTALLDEYARWHPLPDRHEAHLEALAILRRMQLLLWILESREHAAFRDGWQSWARKEMNGLSTALDVLR